MRGGLCAHVVVMYHFCLQLERLDSDLKNYRSNSIRESIRRGFDALGDHYLDCGELKCVHFRTSIVEDYLIWSPPPHTHTHFSQALKMYMRARDHCTSNKHIVQLCLNIIKVSCSFCYVSPVTFLVYSTFHTFLVHFPT